MAGSRARIYVPALLLGGGLLVLLGLGPSLHHGFTYDDHQAGRRLAENPEPWSLLAGPRGFARAFDLLDYAVWADQPFGYQLTNLLLHFLAVVVAGLLAGRISRSPFIGLATGFFFAVHPIHVEVVASFANRKDMLAFIMAGVTLRLWLDSADSPWRQFAAFVCLALALWAKEVAAAGLILLLPLADLCFGEQSKPRPARFLPPVLLVLIAAGYLLAGHLDRFSPRTIEDLTMGGIDDYGGLLVQILAAVPRQLQLLWLPFAQSPEYALFEPARAGALFPFGLVILVLASLLVIVLAKRRPLPAFPIAWTLLTWLPAANLIPLSPYLVADRYLYVPSWGVCFLLALMADRARQIKPWAGALLTIVLLIAGLGQSRSYLADWRDDETLWSAAVSRGHHTHRAHAVLGTLAYNEGRLDKAVHHLNKAHELLPRGLETRIKLMIALADEGRMEQAGIHAHQVLEALPGQADANRIAGMNALMAGDHHQAVACFTRFLETRPDNVDALNNLAWLHAASPHRELRDGRRALFLAEKACRASGRTNPNHLLTLAMAHAENADFPTALTVLDEAEVPARAAGAGRLLDFSRRLRAHFKAQQPYRAGK